MSSSLKLRAASIAGLVAVAASILGCGESRQETLAFACAAFHEERISVQSCVSSDQCGQILVGTSCGCTRELVARKDADTARFFALKREIAAHTNGASASQATCADPGFGSDCDCPAAKGFACVQGSCTWNYTP